MAISTSSQKSITWTKRHQSTQSEEAAEKKEEKDKEVMTRRPSVSSTNQRGRAEYFHMHTHTHEHGETSDARRGSTKPLAHKHTAAVDHAAQST